MTTSTTSRPRPPWFPETPASSWDDLGVSDDGEEGDTDQTVDSGDTVQTDTNKDNVDPANIDDIDTEDREDESTIEDVQNVDVTPKVIKVKVPKPLNPIVDVSDINSNVVGDDLTAPEVVSIANFTRYCAPVTARGLFWNWTSAGDTAVLQCPHDSTGFAKWRCGTSGPVVEWEDISPSLAECQSKWLNNLDSRLRDGEAISSVSSDLAQMSGLQQMYGGDLQLASRMLKHMAERMHFDIQAVVGPGQREGLVTDLVQNVVMTASNILDKINHVSWADLSHDDVAAAATSLMIGLEENAFLLADSVTTEKIIIKPTNNILLSIRVMQARNTKSQKFPTVENLEMWDNQEDSIELASSSLQDNSENGAVRIIFATYNEFDQLLVPVQRSGLNSSLRFVNSKVISASLGKGRHIKLREPVKITLKHLKMENVSSPVCVYWDYTSQAWSNTGCQMIGTNVSHTQCQCDHLTNFALIMEDSPGEVVASSLASWGGQVTTIIACVATLICASLMVISLVLAWRKFRVTHQCRSMLQKSGIPCFHKTKELSEKDKKQGNFYTVTPKLNGSVNNNSGKPEANIEMDNQQYFEHMIAMQKNQENLVINKTISRRNTLNNSNTNDTQETVLSEVDLSKPNNVSNLNLNNVNTSKKNYKAKTQCQHVLPNNFQLGGQGEVQLYPKKSNVARAMSPFNHIYMEIDQAKLEDGAAMYEAINSQSEVGSRTEPAYMLSSVSDMSDDDFRRCSDISRQSSSRYAENKPLIRSSLTQSRQTTIPSTASVIGGQPLMERNLLTTISSVMNSQNMLVSDMANMNSLPLVTDMAPPNMLMTSATGSQSMRVAPQHHHRTSILSTISGLRYTVDGPEAVPEAPVQVTTNVDGDQFVCLNLNNPPDGLQPGNPGDLYQQQPLTMVDPQTFPTTSQQQQQLINFGTIQAPVHSQLVIQRVGTLPRQYAHPLAQL